LAAFPFGWSEQSLAFEADLLEASHTYRIKGSQQYLTLVEAQGERRRYYKAYVAENLEGPWKGLAIPRKSLSPGFQMYDRIIPGQPILATANSSALGKMNASRSNPNNSSSCFRVRPTQITSHPRME